MYKYYSQANQDEFVFNILNKQITGTFIDIGSSKPIYWNNSFFLECLDWNGICIDIIDCDYSERKCKYYSTDVLKIDYQKLFEDNNIPKIIDYLSIDVDDLSSDCLEKIPLEWYRFKVITIEHDHYIHGDKLRGKQRALLTNNNYYLICSDVTCLPLKSDQYFEDWWVDISYLDDNLIDKIKCDKLRCDDIVKKFY